MSLSRNSKGIILALFCTLIVSVAQILLKLGSEDFSLAPTQILAQFSNYPLLIGALLYALGAVVFIKAFRLGDLSVIYPVMASGYVVVTILSMIFLRELITLQKGVGMFFITLGVVFIGLGGNQ